MAPVGPGRPTQNHVPFINDWNMATNYTQELTQRDKLVGDSLSEGTQGQAMGSADGTMSDCPLLVGLQHLE